ncbi:MAG: fructose-bisphosphate aldolase [Euryarchaeota archaeon]|jgi:fructose-bisphosphate aldolase/2-amino-3,7-dideoxy-D-threo-hept-6-ulosonate synthase|nr:fructose-bisphosphate aldolase [Euryarchaeota archaeon]MEE2626368.1 2-amino-3,7-dideoxy-D-threo-hept-6-ulosonate synthase [Candidatus Thermoplasmatota archaeon]|tara:strand:+ start:2817 stop:3590 length:774 start_codon:yes stop_codon:yes gene_type:complete
MANTLEERLERILPGGKGVWIPMDHGASSFPVDGLTDTEFVVDSVIGGGADAIVLQKGLLSHHHSRNGWDGYVCHISVSTIHGGERSQDKVSVATASEALLRGANGVSAQVNLGDKYEPEMIQRLGELSRQAYLEGLPVLGMVYPRGTNLVIEEGDSTRGVAHAARIAWELGCHVVKVPWTGSPESFSKVVEAVPIPVLLAGGENEGDFSETLSIVREAMDVGCSGICFGRQVFGSKDPESCVKALREIVHAGENAR